MLDELFCKFHSKETDKAPDSMERFLDMPAPECQEEILLRLAYTSPFRELTV